MKVYKNSNIQKFHKKTIVHNSPTVLCLHLFTSSVPHQTLLYSKNLGPPLREDDNFSPPNSCAHAQKIMPSPWSVVK